MLNFLTGFVIPVILGSSAILWMQTLNAAFEPVFKACQVDPGEYGLGVFSTADDTFLCFIVPFFQKLLGNSFGNAISTEMASVMLPIGLVSGIESAKPGKMALAVWTPIVFLLGQVFGI
jgi:hypothetical protein